MSIAPKADGQRKKIVYMAKRRIKMAECLYCDGEKDNFSTKPLFEDELTGPVGSCNLAVDVLPNTQSGDVLLVSLGEYVGSVRINYCPMCGRKLREAADSKAWREQG